MKIISNKEYKEYMKLKSEEKINEFAKRGWRANSLALSFEQVIIYLMKKFKIQEFELNDLVEIIEDTPEDKKIEKLDLSDWLEITSSADCKPEMLAKIFNKNAKAFSSKINEIIDKVNGI